MNMNKMFVLNTMFALVTASFLQAAAARELPQDTPSARTGEIIPVTGFMCTATRDAAGAGVLVVVNTSVPPTDTLNQLHQRGLTHSMVGTTISRDPIVEVCRAAYCDFIVKLVPAGASLVDVPSVFYIQINVDSKLIRVAMINKQGMLYPEFASNFARYSLIRRVPDLDNTNADEKGCESLEAFLVEHFPDHSAATPVVFIWTIDYRKNPDTHVQS